MNTLTLKTERLILRKPWFPLRTMEDAEIFYEEQFACKSNQVSAYNYSICLNKDSIRA